MVWGEAHMHTHNQGQSGIRNNEELNKGGGWGNGKKDAKQIARNNRVREQIRAKA